jgi:hypothetical protein
MSNELQRAFASLTEDTARVRLATAGDLRRRGDRRQAVARTVGGAAAVVLVAGAVVGARIALAGPQTPPPQPAPADSRPPSPSPPSASPSPPATPASSPAAPVPTSIPDRAFLQESDMPGKSVETPLRTDHELPRFCGYDYLPEGRIGVRSTQRYALREADAPAGSTPRAVAFEEIMVFRRDGATQFLASLRAAMRYCPAGGGGKEYFLRGTIGAGDDSVLLEQTSPARGDDGELTGSGSNHLYWVAVRVGDTVAFVSNTGYESVSADRADTEHLGRRAGARLADWR